MSPHRFLVPGLPAAGRPALPPEAVRHLKVLRLKPGDEVVLFDGAGREMRARLEKDGRTAFLLAEVVPGDGALPIRWAAFSPPRGERLDWLLEKAVELGAAEIVLLGLERTPPRSRQVRPERLERILGEACAQCGRARLPRLTGPVPLAALLSREDLPPVRWLLDPAGGPLAAGGGSGAVVVAGPEGGLADAEREALGAAGFAPASLGPLTLRVETAILAALSRLG